MSDAHLRKAGKLTDQNIDIKAKKDENICLNNR